MFVNPAAFERKDHLRGFELNCGANLNSIPYDSIYFWVPQISSSCAKVKDQSKMTSDKVEAIKFANN